MSINMTWATYAQIAGVCLVLYYCLVFLFFRRKKMSAVSDAIVSSFLQAQPGSEKVISNDSLLFDEEAIPQRPLPPKANDSSQSVLSRSFADELQAFTEESGTSSTKEEIVSGLESLIQKYPSLKESGDKYQLNQ